VQYLSIAPIPVVDADLIPNTQHLISVCHRCGTPLSCSVIPLLLRCHSSRKLTHISPIAHSSERSWAYIPHGISKGCHGDAHAPWSDPRPLAQGERLWKTDVYRENPFTMPCAMQQPTHCAFSPFTWVLIIEWVNDVTRSFLYWSLYILNLLGPCITWRSSVTHQPLLWNTEIWLFCQYANKTSNSSLFLRFYDVLYKVYKIIAHFGQWKEYRYKTSRL